MLTFEHKIESRAMVNQTIDPKHLMSAQEVVASTLSGSDVAVVFDADTPWTDLSNRVIHLRPIPEQLDDELIEDIRGDCDHELGHILYTDPEVIDGIKRKLVLKITGAIEDGRVEGLVASEWLGCGENLERSSDRAVSRIMDKRTDDEANRRARAVCGLSLVSYGRPLDEVVSLLGDDLEGLYQQIDSLVTSLPSCDSTQEALTLAEQIADLWDWQLTTSGRAKSRRAKENAAAIELDQFVLSPADERKKTISALSAGARRGAYRARTDKDRSETIRKPSFELGNLYGVFFEGVRKTAPVLRRRLMMQFRSSGHSYKRFQKRGELDERNLWRTGLSDERIYRTSTPTMTNRSIVTILVDCSASMTRAARGPEYEGESLVLRTRLFVAAQAAAAVSAALDSLGVPNEVLAFTTSKRTPRLDKTYDRVRGLRHLIIKPFNRPFLACRGNFVALAFFEHCAENIDGEAILWAARRMLSKPDHGDRPVLMVFSDGEPASSPEKAETLASHLKFAVDKVEAAGVDVFGIGVGSDAVERFYHNSVVVHSVSNLLSTFYDLLKKVLSRRQVVGV